MRFVAAIAAALGPVLAADAIAWQWRDDSPTGAVTRPLIAERVGERILLAGQSGYEDGPYASVLDAGSLATLWRASLSPLGSARVDASVPFEGGVYVIGLRGTDNQRTAFVARIDTAGAVGWIVDLPWGPELVALAATPDGVVFTDSFRVTELAFADGRMLRSSAVGSQSFQIEHVAADDTGLVYAAGTSSTGAQVLALSANDNGVRWSVPVLTAGGLRAQSVRALYADTATGVLVLATGTPTDTRDRALQLSRLSVDDGSVSWRTGDDPGQTEDTGQYKARLCAQGASVTAWFSTDLGAARLLNVRTSDGTPNWVANVAGGWHLDCSPEHLLATGNELVPGSDTQRRGFVERRDAVTGALAWRTAIGGQSAYLGVLSPDGSALVVERERRGYFDSAGILRRIASDGQPMQRVADPHRAGYRGAALLTAPGLVHVATTAATHDGLEVRRSAIDMATGAEAWRIAEPAEQPSLARLQEVSLSAGGGAVSVRASAAGAVGANFARSVSVVHHADALTGVERYNFRGTIDGSRPLYASSATGPDGSLYLLSREDSLVRAGSFSSTPTWSVAANRDAAPLLALPSGVLLGRDRFGVSTASLLRSSDGTTAWRTAPAADALLSIDDDRWLGAERTFVSGGGTAVTVTMRDVATGDAEWTVVIPFGTAPVTPAHLLTTSPTTSFVLMRSPGITARRRAWIARIDSTPPAVAWLREITLGQRGVSATSLIATPAGDLMVGIRPDQPLFDDDTGSSDCGACPEYLVAISPVSGDVLRWHHAGTFGSTLPPDQPHGVAWLGSSPGGDLLSYEQHWDGNAPIGLRVRQRPMPTPATIELTVSARAPDAVVANGVLSVRAEITVSNASQLPVDGAVVESTLPPGYAISEIGCTATPGGDCGSRSIFGQFRQHLSLAQGASATIRLLATRMENTAVASPPLQFLVHPPFALGTSVAATPTMIEVPPPRPDAIFRSSFE